MSYIIVGRGPDGALDVGVGGLIEPCDKVAVCFWDHQRQPFLIRDLNSVTAQDLAVALKKSRGVEIGLLPFNSALHTSVDVGSTTQMEDMREGLQGMILPTNSPAYYDLDREGRNLLRNLVMVAYERPDGEIVPFTNMLTHQWYNDSEERYRERIASNATRLHFFVCSSIDSINANIDEFNV